MYLLLAWSQGYEDRKARKPMNVRANWKHNDTMREAYFKGYEFASLTGWASHD